MEKVGINRVAFITNIAPDAISGGFSAMNRAMFDVLAKDHVVDYIGPVNPKPSFWKHALSKSRRLMGLGGDFYFFSERRLEVIRELVEARLGESRAEFAVFHGFTPWIEIRPKMPYIAWSDCTFWQYVDIYHDATRFRNSDLERIKEREAAWLRNAHRVIFRSEWAAAGAIRDYDLAEDRVGVVGNYGYLNLPVNLSYEGGLDFLMITTNFRQKGGFIAVEALRRVRRTHPNTRLLLIGSDPGRKIRHEPGVIYLGWVDKSNAEQVGLLRHTLSKVRGLVHPTLSDTNPMVLIEAGYFGCPAITTRRYAIPELVNDGVSGILLDDPTDVPSLVTSMIWMLDENEAYLRMREETYNHMMSYYTREAFQIRLDTQIKYAEGIR